MLGARVSVATQTAVMAAAKEERRTISQMVELLLESALAARKNGAKK